MVWTGLLETWDSLLEQWQITRRVGGKLMTETKNLSDLAERIYVMALRGGLRPPDSVLQWLEEHGRAWVADWWRSG